ncbi:P-loop containing nucleoside triphosphate hydrolase protein [Saccharata proteae CBS 121410]|uniref:P-loop containing nucleoside triphosphate hydrolase protein n=1 Tax=Saccharata proteae CBS 121410 TaxID=1314787 RepID=A0A9P4LYR4_9PEZI|nr:P-loop containing nucleoside triphosphate hydrolase protein [Saccharata proteae CBS 121410]
MDGVVIEILAAAVQRGCSCEVLSEYLKGNSREEIKEALDVPIANGWHILHFAVRRNDLKCLQLLLDYGADPNAKGTVHHIPVHAWAIMLPMWTGFNSTNVVKMLLEYGANPEAVPRDLWFNYVAEPSLRLPSEPETAPSAQWCLVMYRVLLVETMHITHRYSFFVASLADRRYSRLSQIVHGHNMQQLLRIPYRLISQGPATRLVKDQICSDIAFHEPRPLVMIFAGPSGHGKTELAKQLGDLLGVESLIEDMSKISNSWELFGPGSGYLGSEEGSRVNNFLSKNTGQRCVVFLDEFDKTEAEVRLSLLTVMENGQYFDRRDTTRTIDASRVIWILASNLGDGVINRFYEQNLKDKSEVERYTMSAERLQHPLREQFISSWGAPFVGRVRLMIPFFQFSPDEQAVVAHKQMLELFDTARRPIDTHSDNPYYIGHCHLDYRHPTDIARLMAKRFYSVELGARGLWVGKDELKRKLWMEYTRTDQEVTESTNEGPLHGYICELDPGDDGSEQITITRKGETKYRA